MAAAVTRAMVAVEGRAEALEPTCQLLAHLLGTDSARHHPFASQLLPAGGISPPVLQGVRAACLAACVDAALALGSVRAGYPSCRHQRQLQPGAAP